LTGEQGSGNGGITRRRFVRDAGITTVAAADALSPTIALARRRPRPRRPTMAVFGGGVAGFTAAHELAERGFDVTIYERRAWGGKARSTWVPGSATGGRKPLPGEHGFRFEFGFYRNLPDTLRRISFTPNASSVLDNILDAPDAVFSPDGGRPDLYVPIEPTKPLSIAPERLVGTLSVLTSPDLPPTSIPYLANRIAVFLSSCDRRRHEQWERTPWTDFLAVDRYPDRIIAELPRFTQAANAKHASTDWMGQAVEGLLQCLSGRGNGSFLRLLNGPTNETWINPWIEHLRALGVQLRLGYAINSLELHRGRIAAAHINGPTGRCHRVQVDCYVCALPVEKARRLWNRQILGADPSLERMNGLQTDWMNGMKLFLGENRPLDRGVVDYADAPWALSSVNQAQFWTGDFASVYGDGRVKDSLSVVIANWHEPGIVYGKPASECTPTEVVREVWEQIKGAVNKPGQAPKLTDDLLVSWNIDPGMTLRHGHLVSEDPLVLPVVGTRPDRPDARTKIPNLVLAGDYLNTDGLIATMEGANEGGRLAANAVIDQTRSSAAPVEILPHFRPPEWEPFKQIDEQRYKQGQANLFDTNLTLAQLNGLLNTTGLFGIQPS
jgi:uncharacterized protein with NAD-binding domain and iron-sulfur cluster